LDIIKRLAKVPEMSKTETLVKTENNGEKQLARSLNVLIPLIKDDLAAAEKAGVEYHIAAGEKLIEARYGGDMSRGQWGPWLKTHFKFGARTALRYMELAAAQNENGTARRFRNLDEFRLETEPSYVRYREKQKKSRKRKWAGDIREKVKRARAEAAALEREKLTRKQQREMERKLAIRLIDIGYKILSVELHPDKGGSHEAMLALNAVRARLKGCA
jgi:hypothetical protein